MKVLKVTKVGNSIGIVFSKELLTKLRIGKGSKLYWIETPTGIELIHYDPEFAKQVDVAEEVMRENRDALKKLSE